MHGRHLKFITCILYLASCILYLTSFAHALDVPKLQGYVNDYANMISPEVRSDIENKLKAFEQTDSTQIVILTIPSLEGEVLEEFSIKVAESWKIGQKVKDNGVIFLVAKEERKMRIEVGRGLEGKVTDLMAGRIIDLVIKPRFKEGDFDGGFEAGVSALIEATRGEFKADGKHRHTKIDDFLRFSEFLIFGIVILVILGNISRIIGGIAGAIGLPALVHLILFPVGIITLIVLACIGLGAGLILPVRSSSGRYSRGGGFYWGGGGMSGGGFGGGGFGGGGGGFGGGGASGGW
ncbi:MAG: methanol dehydrogenase [Nitrospira sp.]|nr:methanol dehydrogenase [Nitrospira sp.]